MEDNYPKAYKEVMKILNFVPKESVEKIPRTMIDTFEAKMDKDYDFKVDINKSFEEQNLLEETKAIFANIFRDYWATPYQKERIIAKQNYDRKVLEEEKRRKYNPDSLFEKITKDQNEFCNNEINNNLNNNLPVEYKKTFYQKIIGFFKRIFNL